MFVFWQTDLENREFLTRSIQFCENVPYPYFVPMFVLNLSKQRILMRFSSIIRVIQEEGL